MVIVHPEKLPVSNPGLFISCAEVGVTVKLAAGFPLNETAEAAVQFLPEIVTGVPWTPLGGFMDVIVGNPVTVKPMNEDDVPMGVVTVKVRSPAAAPADTEIVIGRLVPVPPLPIAAVTPVPLKVTAVAPDRLAPVIVARTVAPTIAELGDIDVNVMGAPTIKPLYGADIAVAVVTVMVRSPVEACGVIDM